MNELKIYDCSGLPLNSEQPYVYWDRVRKFMEFSGMSFATLARKTCTPESTLRKLFQGVTKDPRLSTVLAIFRVLDLDANVALGLSPPRDYEAEAARENVPLTDSLRQQLAEVRAERDAQLTELDRLRKLVLAKGEAMSRLEGKAADVDDLTAKCADQQSRLEYKAEKIQSQAEEIAHLRATLEARDKTVANLETMVARGRKTSVWVTAFAAAMVIAFIALAAFYIWDITHLTQGPTSWLNPEFLQ